MRRFLARLANLFRRRRADQEMAREITAHLALLQEDFERNGFSPSEAVLAARRAYGGVEQSKELHRQTRSFIWVEQLWQDIRYSVYTLRRSPGFTLTAISALTLGIGTTIAIFSLVNAVLLKPLPLPDEDRFVAIMNTGTDAAGENSPFASPARFIYWRTQSDALESIAANLAGSMNYTGGNVLERWPSMRVSADFFRAWGIRVVRGRTFTPEEDLPGGPRVVVIGTGLWKRRFASDPGVLGKTISLNGDQSTVIGVVEDPVMLPMGASTATDVYTPFQIDPNTTDHGQVFFVVARLKPGVTLAQAKERMKASATQFWAKFPVLPKDGFTVETPRDVFRRGTGSLLIVLSGAVGLVLLIACANVASLLLVRSASRQREIGIRLAVGAGRGRMIRQLLTESVLLSLTGGLLGTVFGHLGIRALLTLVPDLLPFGAITMDGRVLAFSLAASLLTGLVFGSLPALHGSRVDLNSVLKDSGGRWGTGLRQNKTRTSLVLGEVSLAVVLLVGSALLIRTFVALYTVERGFETKNIITLQTALTSSKYAKASGVEIAVKDGLKRLQGLPGVKSAGATACCVPLLGGLGLQFNIVGLPPAEGQYTGGSGWSAAAPGFFETLQIPVKRGRSFTFADNSKAPPVAIISDTMAKEFWKDRDPLNDRIIIAKGLGKEWEDLQVRQIVGIVGNVRQGIDQLDPEPHMYVPQAQLPDSTNAYLSHLAPMQWVVRTQDATPQLSRAIEEQLRQATGAPVFEVQSMEQIVSLSTAQRRFNMILMSVFGCSALVLAAIGIYGLIAFTVEQRTQEIGIRLALGAEATQVRNMVMRQGVTLALVGIAVGLGAAWGLSRLMEGLLFGVQARDPLVFGAAPAALGAVALLAVWLPARRALRVDPAIALRHE